MRRFIAATAIVLSGLTVPDLVTAQAPAPAPPGTYAERDKAPNATPARSTDGQELLDLHLNRIMALVHNNPAALDDVVAVDGYYCHSGARHVTCLEPPKGDGSGRVGCEDFVEHKHYASVSDWYDVLK